ncbi:MAG: T9SS type A sorting domain-containing protein [Bacteroidota bacterium]|nr:T9SS type A sorting domain-containing protein [Bacteroidota bacterium]
MKTLSLLISFCLLAGFSLRTIAQPGSLDNTFGTGGVAIGPSYPSDDRSQDMLIQPDGKILLGGYSDSGTSSDFSIARYNADGTPDNNFGTNGIVFIDLGTDSDWCWSIALQADGKILMGGTVYHQFTTNNDFALVRLNSNGTADITFGTGGIVTTDIEGLWDDGYDVALQADGKILLGGEAYIVDGRDFCIVRYNPDGTLDNTFGTAGVVLTSFGSVRDRLRNICLQDDGKIVACGWTENASEDDIAVARYNTDGNLDNTFGTGGMLVLPSALASERAWDIKMQSDGKMLLSGYSNDNGFINILLARLNTDGSPDNTFGNNGISIPVFSGNEMGLSFALQGDGKILVTGEAFHFSLSRYLTDGSVDTEFGEDGIVITNPGTGYSFSTSVAVQSDGKIVVGGYAENDDTQNFTLIRYHAEESGGIKDNNITFQSAHLYPNPVPGNSFTIEYLLSSRQEISIELLTSDGKMLQVWQSRQSREAGIITENLLLPEIIATGIYFIRLSSPRESIMLKLNVE